MSGPQAGGDKALSRRTVRYTVDGVRFLAIVCVQERSGEVGCSMPGQRASDTGHKALCPVSQTYTQTYTQPARGYALT